jgi:uncharacterized protein HemY
MRRWQKVILSKRSMKKRLHCYIPFGRKSNQSVEFYRPLLTSYYKLKSMDEAEKLIRKQIKKFSDNPIFAIDLGYLYLQKGEAANAQKQFEKVVKDLRPNDTEIRQTADYFQSLGETQL